MPRQLRLELAGGHYHVMARGDHREDIFLDNVDRQDFLGQLGGVCRRHGWRVHAWVLMSNHYHLLLETPQPNLVSGMRQLQQGYTQRFNRRHAVSGHLFGGRYKAVLVEGQLEGLSHPAGSEMSDYFTMVADYIHLNPLRAGLVRLNRGRGLLGYEWSSLKQAYAQPPTRRTDWIEVGHVLRGYDQSDSAKGRQRMIAQLEEKASAQAARKAGLSVPEAQSLQSTMRRGWYFGSQAFAERTLKLAKKLGRKLGRKGEHYEAARLAREHGEKEAERLSVLGLRKVLERQRRHPGEQVSDTLAKAAVANLVRARTSVSTAWLAKRFGFGSAENASQQMYYCRRQTSRDKNLASLVTLLGSYEI